MNRQDPSLVRCRMSGPPSSPMPSSPPSQRLVTRIKPVTSPRTSMKLLALQHYANVYAAAAAAEKTGTSSSPPTTDATCSLPSPLDEGETTKSNTTTTTTTTTISTLSPPSTTSKSVSNRTHVEAALELPFNPASGSEVTRFEETGDSGQFTIFP